MTTCADQPHRSHRRSCLLPVTSVVATVALLFAALPACAQQPAAPAAQETPKLDPKRLAAEDRIAFDFTYAFELTNLPPGANQVRIWAPLPREDALQQAEITSLESPVPVRFTREGEFGNRMIYAQVDNPAGKPLRWKMTYSVVRRQQSGAIMDDSPDAPMQRYLAPDQLVPTTGFITDIARGIGAGNKPVKERGDALYDYCLNAMSYSKQGEGWGRGDVKWACDAKYGNCSDFHSVFIALARVRRIPAKFEMGFPLPYEGDEGDIGGYHCWAKYYEQGAGWRAIDISEADKYPELAAYFRDRLHARRVHFTTGRDITLVPQQAGPPVNFLIYPYIEVDGKPVKADRMQYRFYNLKVLDRATAEAQ